MNRVRILVTGATGYVGSRLVTALFDDGHHVVAATRNPERLAEFGWYSGVTAVALDTNYEASARAAFAEAGPIDVLYYLVHGTASPAFAMPTMSPRQTSPWPQRMPALSASCSWAGSCPTMRTSRNI